MSSYRDFVKQHMSSLSGMPQKEKMGIIAAMWHKQKGGKSESMPKMEKPKTTRRKKITGGQVDDKEQPESSDTKDTKQQTPAPKQTPTPKQIPVKQAPARKVIQLVPSQVALDNGIPPILTIHPNLYSANPLTFYLFTTMDDWFDSNFYKKYSDRMTKLKPIKDYSGYTRPKEVPFKLFRIGFTMNSFKDRTVWYLDPKDADEYISMLVELKDEDKVFQPVEFVSAKFMQLQREKSKEGIASSEEAAKYGYQLGAYDMAVQRNNVIEDRQAQWARENQLQVQGAYYEGQVTGMEKQGDISERLVRAMPQTTVNVSSGGGGDGGGDSSILGTVGNVVGSFFGI